MKLFTHIFCVFLFLSAFGQLNILAQEEQGTFKSTIQFKGNNSLDPEDMSGLPEMRQETPEETRLMKEINELRQRNDRTLLGRIQELENQLEELNPNSVSKPSEYYDGEVGKGNDNKNVFPPEAITNVEIFNSGSAFISAIATATEQRGSTEGRIWVAFSIRTTGAADTIRAYYSDDNGTSWTYYAWGKLGGTDQINYDEMDMEIIENATGEKYIWIVYGYRNDASSGRWRTGGLVLQNPTFGGQFFALSWPGDDVTKRYYRLRITSDNAWYAGAAYTYMVASFDSSTGSSRINTQKTLRCTNPYTITPTFQYKADNFWWFSGSGNIQRDLHSDIAYFRNNGDSIIVSFSNVPDSTKLFFAKSNISNGPATADGAGGFIGGSQPDDHKQFARLSSNGNDNGSIYCLFRQNTNSVWRIKYFRTTNHGNFNTINQSTLQGSASSDSYQPEIVGVRNMPKHYFAWRVDGSPDSVRYIGTNSLGQWPQNVSMMNSQSSISGITGVKPGFRYVNSDSCLAFYSLFGPFDVWTAYGCSGTPFLNPPLLVSPPDNAVGVDINPTLEWDPVGGASSYHVQVYLNGTTLVFEDNNVMNSSIGIGPLDFSSMYTWQVASNNNLGTGPFSDPFTFTTLSPNSINVSSPNGGEIWEVGSSQDINWSSSGVTDVRIELSINNGASWTDVIASTPSTGSYSWMVPNTPSAQCLIRISAVGNPSIQDQSDAVFSIEITPGVEDELSGIPEDYRLLQNYPNPFNPSTTIYYGLPQESSVNLIVFDILGNEIFKVTEEQKPAGYHKVTFDASNLMTGVYFYRLEAGNYIETRKMILMK